MTTPPRDSPRINGISTTSGSPAGSGLLCVDPRDLEPCAPRLAFHARELPAVALDDAQAHPRPVVARRVARRVEAVEDFLGVRRRQDGPRVVFAFEKRRGQIDEVRVVVVDAQDGDRSLPVGGRRGDRCRAVEAHRGS